MYPVVTGLGDKRDTFFSNKCPFLNWLYTSTVGFVLLPKKATKKSTMAKRVGQITHMCYPTTTRAYCCTNPNWIGSSRLWNTRHRPHGLGLPAYIFAVRKKIAGRFFAGRYFREKIFSREDIFAGIYFRVDSIFAKISSRENISNPIFAKFSSRENKVLYSK